MEPNNQTLPGDGVELSDEQQAAVDTILKTPKKRIVLTGAAGSGKSTVLNHLRATGWWEAYATTGKAAMHIEGGTVDSAYCFSRDNWQVWNEDYLKMVMLQTSDNHIIDEASMIGKNMGDCIDATAKAYHKKLVMSGDWAQAAPVKDDLILKSRILDDFEFIKLTENHRQADAEYINALNQVRVGKAGKDVEEAFSGCLCAKPPDDDHFLRMYATNQKTEAYNQFRLWRHVDDTASGAFQLCASFKDVRDGDKQKKRPRSESFRMNAIANSPFSHGEPLAVGCRVLITVNDHAREYVNGDTGTLMSATVGDGRQVNEAIAAYKESGRNFSVSSVRVLLDRTGKEVTVFYQLREVKDPTGRYVQHAISGLPVKLGYACTTHKSQGMTVERAWFDMGSLGRFPDDKSRHGLAYVALSRTKSLEGLLISQWVPEMIYCNPEIAELL